MIVPVFLDLSTLKSQQYGATIPPIVLSSNSEKLPVFLHLYTLKSQQYSPTIPPDPSVISLLFVQHITLNFVLFEPTIPPHSVSI